MALKYLTLHTKQRQNDPDPLEVSICADIVRGVYRQRPKGARVVKTCVQIAGQEEMLWVHEDYDVVIQLLKDAGQTFVSK